MSASERGDVVASVSCFTFVCSRYFDLNMACLTCKVGVLCICSISVARIASHGSTIDHLHFPGFHLSILVHVSLINQTSMS